MRIFRGPDSLRLWLEQRAIEMRRKPTKAELHLRKHLRQHGYHVDAQKVFGRYIVDFYLRQHRLVIEVDGGSHRLATQRAYDQRRTRYLYASHKVAVLRFSNREVMDGTFQHRLPTPKAIERRPLKPAPVTNTPKFSRRRAGHLTTLISAEAALGCRSHSDDATVPCGDRRPQGQSRDDGEQVSIAMPHTDTPSPCTAGSCATSRADGSSTGRVPSVPQHQASGERCGLVGSSPTTPSGN